jgi:hypothetical protein
VLFVCPLDEVERIAQSFEVEFLLIFPDGGFFKSKYYQGELF